MSDHRGRADPRFEQATRALAAAVATSDPGEVSAAIRRLREVAALPSPRDEHIVEAAVLVAKSALPMLTQTAGEFSYAVDTFRSLMDRAALPDDHRAALLWDTGYDVLGMAETTVNTRHATEAVNLGDAAVAAADPGKAMQAVALLLLGDALRFRYRIAARPSDLDQAAAVYTRALDAHVPKGQHTAPPDALWSTCQEGLASCLLATFERTGDREKLDGAIEAFDAAVEFAGQDNQRAGYLQSLSMALQRRYQSFGDPADMARALSIAAELVAASPGPEDDKLPGRLGNLAAILCERHARTGQRADLDDAIGLLRTAVRIRPDDAMLLSNLGSALTSLYQLTRDSTVLAEAVRLEGEAVTHSNRLAPDHPRKLSSYATTLITWYQRHDDVAALDKAISALRQALSSARSGPREHVVRSNLAMALSYRWAEPGGTPEQHSEAIALLEQVAQALPEGHPDRSTVMVNLSSLIGEKHQLDALEREVQRAGEQAEARARAREEAKRAGIEFVPDAEYPDEPPDLADVNKAITLAEAAVRELSAEHPRHPERLLALGLAYRDRFVLTGDAKDMHAALAACAMAARSAHAPASIRAFAGETWAELAAAQHDWHAAAEGYRIAIDMLPHLAARDLQRDDQEHRLSDFPRLATTAAAAQLRCDGDQIRAFELLEQGRGVIFAQAMQNQGELTALRDDTARLDALMAQANDGPIAAVNVSDDGCHALILTNQDVRAIPLTALSRQDVHDRAEAFRIALDVLDHADFSAEDRWAASRFVTRTLGWLWDVIAEPVLETLDLARPAPASILPRLWWMPTGMLCFLPLHAAGHHTRCDGSTVMDRVVSSYTPTVRALRQARTTPSSTRPAAKPLVVAMSATDGHHDLPGALHEAAVVRKLLPQVRVLADGHASRAQVRESILGSDLVHFACHAASDVDHPSSSHLLLADGALTVQDIGALHTPDAYLAFLSACGTSRGSEELPEEAIHVSSAFQLAGFPHVIATLWPIADDTAVAIAEHVYRALIENLESGPARAVHAATCALRDAHDGNSPVLWASHIHSGA